MIQQIKEWRMQQLFNEVVNQFQSVNQYEKFIKEASKEYDIKIYRLQSFSLEHACLVYNELYQKYQDKLLSRMSCGWHQNQRRVYVWFMVCYIHYKLLDPIKLVDNEKHWKHISHTFWDKDIKFLKYQLQTILKTRGRTAWKSFQDELLKKVYPKHTKGEWNQVAKEFYFESEGKCFKTPKQCRQRWQNHLNDEIKRGQWTPSQDYILLEEVRSHDKRWARIIPLLHNARTEHMIKNRYKALVNRAMQDKNITQEEALTALLAKKNQESLPQQGKTLKVEVEQKKHESTKMENEDIQFVQSEQIISEPIEVKKEVEPEEKRKRGRPKNAPANSIENTKVHTEPIRPDVNQTKNSHLIKIAEIDGCQMIGDTSRFQHYVFNSQRSDSFFGQQSNSFFKSHLPNGLYDSGHYSVNNSLKFPCDDRSYCGLEQFSIKQDKSGKFEKKKTEDSCMREIQSIRLRPNQSLISRFINPLN